MLCLSLTQPWASLVAIGAKRIESRSWSTAYRGPLAIHAAKRFPTDAQLEALRRPFKAALEAGGYHVHIATSGRRYVTHDLPTGVIVATCTLANCVTTQQILENPITDQEYAFGDYRAGRWAWILEDIIKLAEPIPARGALGLWDFEIEAATV